MHAMCRHTSIQANTHRHKIKINKAFKKNKERVREDVHQWASTCLAGVLSFGFPTTGKNKTQHKRYKGTVKATSALEYKAYSVRQESKTFLTLKKISLLNYKFYFLAYKLWHSSSQPSTVISLYNCMFQQDCCYKAPGSQNTVCKHLEK